MPSVTIELTAELAGRMCNFVHTAMMDGGPADIQFLSVSLASMRRFCCGHKNIASTCFAAESRAWATLICGEVW